MVYDKFGNPVVRGDLLVESHGCHIKIIHYDKNVVTCIHWLPAYIQTRAYFLWLEAGCPHGCDQSFWFQAEQESNCFLISKDHLLNSSFQKACPCSSIG